MAAVFFSCLVNINYKRNVVKIRPLFLYFLHYQHSRIDRIKQMLHSMNGCIDMALLVINQVRLTLTRIV
jgi:hypothetical protein